MRGPSWLVYGMHLMTAAVLFLMLGCAPTASRTVSPYPERSYENFRRLDKEVVALGMTEEEVVRVLGPPDRRNAYPETTSENIVVLWYRVTTGHEFHQDGTVGAPLEYVLIFLGGKVHEKYFWSGC